MRTIKATVWTTFRMVAVKVDLQMEIRRGKLLLFADFSDTAGNPLVFDDVSRLELAELCRLAASQDSPTLKS